MLKEHKKLKYKHDYVKKLKTYITFNKTVRKLYNDYIELRKKKSRENQRLFAVIMLIVTIRVNMKRFGPTFADRYERNLKKSILAGTAAMCEPVKFRAQALFKDFMVKSADRFEKLRHVKIFIGGLIRT